MNRCKEKQNIKRYELLTNMNNGAYHKLVEACLVSDNCFDCNGFNMSIKNPEKQFRCMCSGSCLPASLSKHIISYMNWKLGFITNDEHMNRGNSYDKIKCLCDKCGKVVDTIISPRQFYFMGKRDIMLVYVCTKCYDIVGLPYRSIV